MENLHKFIDDFVASLPTQVSYFYRNGDNRAVAHCLEFNLITSGKDRADAEKRLDTLVRAHILYAFMHQNIGSISKSRAPIHYFNEFYGSDPRKAGNLWVDLPNEGKLIPKRAANDGAKSGARAKVMNVLAFPISIPKMQPQQMTAA